MKSLKIFFLAALVALAGVFTACTEDGNWNAGPNEKGTRVYFSSENATSVTASADAASVAVTIARNETVGDLEVSVSAAFGSNDYASFFTVPQTVIFNDGMETATVNIGYDFSKLVGGESYDITLTVVDETLHSNYGYSEQTITVVCPEPYVLLGKGLYREDLVFSLWTGAPSDFFEVEIYENTNYPGYFFLKNVYTSAFPFEMFFEAYGGQVSGSYVEEDKYFVIDARDPNKVVLPVQNLGLTLGKYGEMLVAMISDAGVGTIDDCAGTFKDGVITFPARGLYIQDSDGGYYGNPNGAFMLLMPGVEMTDYAMTVAYGGMQVAPDNTTVSAVLTGTYGADVASMRYAFFEGDVTAAAAQAAELIIAAAEEEVNVMEFEQGLDEADRVFTVTESDLAAPGVHTIFCVPYNAAGEPQAGEIATVSFYYPGVGGSEAPACEFAAYFYYVEELLPDYASQFPATEYLMWLVEGTDIKSVNLAGFYQTAAIDEMVAANMANGLTEAEIYELFVEGNGDMMPDDYLAQIAQYGYTYDVIKIGAPDVAVTYICTATNIYGSTKTVRCDGKTATATAATSKGAGVLKPEFNPQFSGIFRMKEIK